MMAPVFVLYAGGYRLTVLSPAQRVPRLLPEKTAFL